MSSLFDITGKVIAITGASGVLAGSTAMYLAEQGATLILIDRNTDRMNQLHDRLTPTKTTHLAITTDVTDHASVESAFDRSMERFNRVDALINGAGGNMPGATVGPDQSIFDLKIEDYRNAIDLNLMGSVLPTMIFAKAFAKQRTGSVLNFSSMTADRAITRVPAYSNAKAAIDNFTRWMAVEAARSFGDQVRVNAIAPGFFISNQNRHLLTNEDGSYTERGQSVIAGTPFGRFGKTDEVHGTIHYLISDAARFVTGAVIPVDGGFSAFSGV